MRNQRPVETGEDEFAAGRLPPGGERPLVHVVGAVPVSKGLENGVPVFVRDVGLSNLLRLVLELPPVSLGVRHIC